MLKKIVSNTALFAIILAFVNIFGSVFGSKNSLVGVTVIVSILVLMQENLTAKPTESLIKLIFVNLSLGMVAYISNLNIWAGLLLNFLTMAGLGYLLSFRLNKTIIVPFGLQYLFMLYTPVDGFDLLKRFIGLTVGSLLVMAVQMIVHRKDSIDSPKSTESKASGIGAVNTFNIFGKSFELEKVRGAYALRIGFLTALSAFAVDFLDLQQGRWIVYSVFSLTEIYSESCKQRSLQRLQGTAIGAIIVFALFTFIEDNTVKLLVMLAAGYMDMYTSCYRDKMVCVTISVLASTSLVGSTVIASVERLIYVAIGVLLALLANRIIFERKASEYGRSDFNSISV